MVGLVQIREDIKKGVHVENLTELEVTSARDVIQQLVQVFKRFFESAFVLTSVALFLKSMCFKLILDVSDNNQHQLLYENEKKRIRKK